jgi:uncharacterized protein YuzE
VREGLIDGESCPREGEGQWGSKIEVQRRSTGMAQVKVYYDREGNTLTVWFGNPADEYVAEETGEEIVLMKDREGKVIGFEKLNFTGHVGDAIKVAFETVAV